MAKTQTGGVVAKPLIRLSRLGHTLRQYLPNLVIIWMMIFIFRSTSYYQDLLPDRGQTTLLYVALGYTIMAPLFYLLAPAKQRTASRGYIIYSALKRFIMQNRDYLQNFANRPGMPRWQLTREEKVSFLFLGVKIFFLPLMVTFIFGNYDLLRSAINDGHNYSSVFNKAGFNYIIFPIALNGILILDTLIFAFGYAFESKLLGNRVKSVEPTLFGWVVALMSYGIFFSITTSIIGSIPSEYTAYQNLTWTTIARVAILILMSIYLLASVALGFKASNLTNRGIVGHGPYRFVRHPAYASKNLAWWLALIPVFSLGALFSMAAWSTIYFFRALTEERHLGRDPAYRAYCKKVRYRFIPRVI